MGVIDADSQNRIGIIGATSLVGASLLPLLTDAGWQVTAFSRRAMERLVDGVDWRIIRPHPLPKGEGAALLKDEGGIEWWVCVAPIWVLPNHFTLLEAQGARRVVVLSSTSRFTKDDSTDAEEQAIAQRLADAETQVREWAASRKVEYVILRPTLIYGLGQDKNLTEIARFICRFGFFPLFGQANGLRQPVHAVDVAKACLAAVRAPGAANREYNISGGEMLTYRNMVCRIFTALGRHPRLLSVPLWVFRLAVNVLRRLPRYRQWSIAMAERMNHDLVFDHADATRDLDFLPRAFQLAPEDLPK